MGKSREAVYCKSKKGTYFKQGTIYTGQTKDGLLEELKCLYRERVREAHPDKGGNADEFAAINEAYEKGKHIIEYHYK